MSRRAFPVIFLVCLTATSVECPAQQSTWDAVDGRDIGVTVRTNDHPALGKPFVDRIHQRTSEVLTILLGGSASVVRETTPNIGDWLRLHRLTELTTDHCVQFGLNRHQKEILVDLRYERGVYRASVVEYDRHLQTLCSVRSGETSQRNMVADLAAHLVLQSWSPVGTIVGRQADEFEVEFTDLSRLASVSDWSGIRPGAVLQLFSEVRNRNQPRRVQGRDDQFLIVKVVGAHTLTARPAIPEPAGSTWFSQLGDSRVRYLVRRAAADSSPFNVRVVLQESNSPREGCFVYVSTTMPQPPEQLGEMVGSTTSAGRLAADFFPSGLRYVTVAYEDLTATRPAVPGITGSPMRFVFPSRGTQSACRLKVDRLRSELSDASSLLNIRLKEVEAADMALDADKAEEAAVAAETHKNSVISIRDQAQAIRRAPDDCDEETIRQLDALIMAADQLLGRYQGVGDSVSVIRIKLLQREIDAAWREHRWSDVQTLLGEYVTLKREIGEPDSREERRLDELNTALAVSDRDHLDARTTLERSVGMDNVDDLQGRWSEIRDALDLLIRRRDHFWLRKIYGEFPTWSALLTDEQKRLDALRQSQTLSLEQQEELLEQMKLTEQTTEEFRNTVGPVAKVIQDADQAYQR